MASLLTITALKKEYALLIENNPTDTPRLKRKIVLEYLKLRIDMLEREVAEVSRAKEVLEAEGGYAYEQDDN
jgi:hypothetical protein